MSNDWSGDIKYINLAGQETTIQSSSSETVENLIKKIEEKEGYDTGLISCLGCNNKMLESQKTLKELNFNPQDPLTVYDAKPEGWWFKDFALGNYLGADLLEKLDVYNPSTAEVNKLIEDVYHLYGVKSKKQNIDLPTQPFSIFQNVMNENERKTLISYIDGKRAGEVDLKFSLTCNQLISIVGQLAFDKMKEVFESEPDEIWVRRAEFNGDAQGIKWHVDRIFRTMQVSLNGDSEYQGGKLVFAADGKIFVPSREPGTATIHDENVIHAVTPLKMDQDMDYSSFIFQINIII